MCCLAKGPTFLCPGGGGGDTFGDGDDADGSDVDVADVGVDDDYVTDVIVIQGAGDPWPTQD